MLPLAKILHVSGYSKKTLTQGNYQLDFARELGGVVKINHINFAGKTRMAYPFLPANLVMSVKNGVVHSGGGYFGGGFGVQGAALGMLAGSALNGLSARNKHYGMLTLAKLEPGVTPKIVVLGYQNVGDSEIMKRIEEALPPFMDYWLESNIEKFKTGGDSLRTSFYALFRLMASRGLLTVGQLERIEPGLGSPKSLKAPHVETPSAVADPSPQSTATELHALAKLHDAGSLTDEEFSAAKAELLSLRPVAAISQPPPRAAEVRDQIEASGSFACTISELLARLGEPEPTFDARARVHQVLLVDHVRVMPALTGTGLSGDSVIALALENSPSESRRLMA